MRFVTYNIRYGVGRDGRLDLDRIADTVAGADVVALQEVDRHWPRSDLRDQPRELSKRLPGYWWVFGPSIDLHAPTAFADEVGGGRRQFGTMILARAPVRSTQTVPLPRWTPDGWTMQRSALVTVVDTPIGAVRVTTTHLCYLTDESTSRQLTALANLHRHAERCGGPWTGDYPFGDDGWVVGDEPDDPVGSIVLGDLNVEAGAAPERSSPAWRDHFRDVWDTQRDGNAGTHAAGRIDRCLVTDPLLDSVRRCWIDTGATGSDHQPMWVEFDW